MARVKCLSVDIETLDVLTSTVVIQIAAIPFSMNKDGTELRFGFETEVSPGQLLKNIQAPADYTFYPSIELQLNAERTIGNSTLKFWLQNKNLEVLANILDNSSKAQDGVLNVANALQAFGKEVDEIWMRGTDFDGPILSSLFLPYLPDPLWRYSKQRDLRTLDKLAQLLGIEPPKRYKDVRIEGRNHDAFADAFNQACLIAELHALFADATIKLQTPS